MDDLNPGKENKNLDSIRHYKGTWKEFKDFWKSKGAHMSPYEEWEQEYPKKKKMVNKDPIQMYKTFDDESDEVKENAKSIEQSAGFAIVFGSKVLLGHMSKKGWWGTYTIPKGHLDGKESIKQAAIRETQEEVGIRIPNKLIPNQYKTCKYIKKGKHYKDVHYYTILIDSLDQIGLKDEVIPKSQLQLEEVDWAGFVPIQEAMKRISPVMRPIIESLMVYNSEFMTFESFKKSLEEDNMVAMAGSQQDYPPIQKPFVLKTKKRKGGNEDDEEDDTEEVANVNTVGVGAR